MKMILLVLKKEMREIVRDRNRLAVLIFFNFILLPVLSIIPGFMLLTRTAKSFSKPLEVPVQGIEYAPSLVEFIHENKKKVNFLAVEDVNKMVLDKQASTGLIIQPDFEERIKNGESASVQVIVDKSKLVNIDAEILKKSLNAYNETVLAERLAEKNIPAEYLTPVIVEETNAATDSETTASFMSLFIPGFIMTFGLTNGLSVAISCIAGEKDKQTLEPVLFTAISRIHLVVGKLLAVLTNVFMSALGFLFAFIFYAIALAVAVFFMFKDTEIFALLTAPPSVALSPAVAPTLPNFSAYSVDPLSIFIFIFSILPIIFLGAALQVMISSIARNSEEAFTYALPLSIFSIAPIFAAFFLDEFKPALGHYAIPVFGTILSMRDLLSGYVYAAPLWMMFGSSLLYAVLALAIAVWMFNREEVLLRA